MGLEVKKLQIVFFAHSAGMPDYGMVFGHYFLAREWVRMGHQVSIVAASHVHTRFRQPDPVSRITPQMIDGIRYIWIPTPSYNPQSKLGRVRNIFSYTLRCLHGKLPLEEADLVICSSPHPFSIFPARRLARRFKARLVTEIRDLWPASLIDLSGTSRFHPFIQLTQWSEDYAYRHSDHVVTVLSHAREHMMQRGMDARKYVYIPNGISLSEESDKKALPEGHRQRLQELRKKHPFIVGYAGKLGLSNALQVLLEALALTDDKEVAVALLGGGAHNGELKDRARELKVSDRVLFLEPVAKTQVFDFLDRIDSAYIGLQNKPVFRYGVSPTKLNDFMLAGKPILYAIDEPGDVAEASGACIRCKPEDSRCLASAMKRMKSLSPAEREHMGRKGHDWVIKHRDYEKLAKSFLEAVT